MSDFSGEQVNSVLRHVASMSPGVDAAAGERQLSILAVALCTAARDCGVDRDSFLHHLGRTFEDVQSRQLVPLYGSQ